MYVAQKVPQYIFALLKEKGVDVNDIYLATYCDMDKQHNFCDTYVVLTGSKLYVLSGLGTLEKKQKGRKGLDVCFVETAYTEYLLSDIESIQVEELISSARMVAKNKAGESIFLTSLTNFCKADAFAFAKYFSIACGVWF